MFGMWGRLGDEGRVECLSYFGETISYLPASLIHLQLLSVI